MSQVLNHSFSFLSCWICKAPEVNDICWLCGSFQPSLTTPDQPSLDTPDLHFKATPHQTDHCTVHQGSLPLPSPTLIYHSEAVLSTTTTQPQTSTNHTFTADNTQTLQYTSTAFETSQSPVFLQPDTKQTYPQSLEHVSITPPITKPPSTETYIFSQSFCNSSFLEKQINQHFPQTESEVEPSPSVSSMTFYNSNSNTHNFYHPSWQCQSDLDYGTDLSGNDTSDSDIDIDPITVSTSSSIPIITITNDDSSDE